MERQVKVFLLLGGFWGFDGYITSLGMVLLGGMLRDAGFDVETYQWAHWEKCGLDIKVQKAMGRKTALIGYSGGGSRATWIANARPAPEIDLLVAYDPSPSWQMMDIGKNVKKAICYWNRTPFFFGLGGGRLEGDTIIQTIPIRENHVFVQSDMNLHEKTLQALGAL